MLNNLVPQVHQVLVVDKGYRSRALDGNLAAAGITALRPTARNEAPTPGPATRITQGALAPTAAIWHNSLINNPVPRSLTPTTANPALGINHVGGRLAARRPKGLRRP